MAHKTSPQFTPEANAQFLHGTWVYGLELDEQSRCEHYASVRDVVAIELYCCRQFYACIRCHEALAGHPPLRWPRELLSEAKILCGVCGHFLSAEQYINLRAPSCPSCGAEWNPRCSLHHPLYYSVGESERTESSK